MGSWIFGGGIIGFAITILIIIIIAMLVFKLIKAHQYRNSENSDKNDSLKILKIRFAKGEFDEHEFRKMKEALQG